MIIGLTGGIGTGKSTVVKKLEKMKIPVVDTDIIAREVVQDKCVIEKIKMHISENIFSDENVLDRKKMAEIVFNDEEKREKLNSIMHPLILEKMWEKAREYEKENDIVFVDVPLLFEIGLDKEIKNIVLVCANKDTQIKRIMARDNRSREESVKIINAQMPLYKKREKSNYVIMNNDTIEKLEEKVEKLIEKIRKGV